jgi:hypothetical protein
MSIKRVYLYGYKRASASLRGLQEALLEQGVRCVRRDAHTQKLPRESDMVLMWGVSSTPHWVPRYYVNTPYAIAVASNKLLTFQRFKEAGDVPIPEFTTDIEEATGWLPKAWCVCRTILNSSGGKGIVLAKTQADIVNAPLYVKYKRKQKEFRVHVWKGTIIDVQEKRRRQGEEPTNVYLRNHDNGWVFCHTNIVEPADLRGAALRAVSALALDFGAVDIIYNEKTEKLFVLEVNTAPGIEGITLNKYVEALLQ